MNTTVLRRPGERRNFIRSLKDPLTTKACQDEGYLQSILALAVHDYGVPVARLAAELFADSNTIESWFQEDFPVIPPESVIRKALEVIMVIMQADLDAEAA